eukprot:5229471-Prymnesium_polylepis.1
MFWIPFNRLWQENRLFARRVWQHSLNSWGVDTPSIRGPGYPPRWSIPRSVTQATSATSAMSAMSIYRR